MTTDIVLYPNSSMFFGAVNARRFVFRNDAVLISRGNGRPECEAAKRVEEKRKERKRILLCWFCFGFGGLNVFFFT